MIQLEIYLLCNEQLREDSSLDICLSIELYVYIIEQQ